MRKSQLQRISSAFNLYLNSIDFSGGCHMENAQSAKPCEDMHIVIANEFKLPEEMPLHGNNPH